MTRAKKVSRKPARGAAARRESSPGKAASAAPGVVESSHEDAEVPAEAESPPQPAAAAVAQVSTPPSPAGLKLEASCTLRDSIDMQFQLLAVDFGDSDVLVDGSAVERIDTAGLQMLLSFAKHQAGRGKPVRWTAVSPELMRGSTLLGLTAMLGISDVQDGGAGRGN